MTNSLTASVSSAADAPIPAGAQAVIELFDTELAELKFPDIDQSVLAEAAARVLSEASAVAAAEAALALAREGLTEAQEALFGRCQRALAYARVYAEEDRALSRKLDAISLPRGRSRAAATSASEPEASRRGRRGTPASGPLFLDPAAAPTAEEAAPAESCAA
jgi:hypothetical protein